MSGPIYTYYQRVNKTKIEWVNFYNEYEGGKFAACCGSMSTANKDTFNKHSVGITVGIFDSPLEEEELKDISFYLQHGDKHIYVRENPKHKGLDYPNPRFANYKAYNEPALEGFSAIYISEWYGKEYSYYDWNGNHPVVAKCEDIHTRFLGDLVFLIHTPSMVERHKEVVDTMKLPIIYQSKHFAYNSNEGTSGRLCLTILKGE